MLKIIGRRQDDHYMLEPRALSLLYNIDQTIFQPACSQAIDNMHYNLGVCRFSSHT